ncbi:FAD dependent oxidoreductase [Delitschia confertaspora ATCC 74209]|uniref:FAD dependent oxidoreductase n=1 Tax=Delitschia confertaspora ATCC 74209 TaxID=1513339 RepID=A0A9P4MSM6_9PLEO|nr:FAD dependent oxidoreductase [Delitschia confertaspora ATCC 74209]
MAATGQKKSIVVVGGGIIGSTTAYFLAHHAKFNPELHTITLLEATKIAGGASGKAGGLLALWAYPKSIVPLSYRLHKELAEKHGGEDRWGYRAVHCGQLDTKARASKSAGKGDGLSLKKRTQDALGLLKSAGVPKDLDWVSPEEIQSYSEMGDPSTTAQVHPYQFTTSMAALAAEKGVRIVYGSATSINHSAGAVESVTYTSKDDGTSKTLPADIVILTAGPWTRTIWPSAPISAMRAHSVVIKPSRPVSAYALFTSIEMPHGSEVTPEIYARPNQEVYACGEGDSLIPLPTSSDLVRVDESRCQDIIDQVTSISDELRDGEIMAKQACYLPNVTNGGGPMIGETAVKGLLMGAGHTCWGIQNAPGTAQCLSELVWEGRVRSANIGALDPRKFM